MSKKNRNRKKRNAQQRQAPELHGGEQAEGASGTPATQQRGAHTLPPLRPLWSTANRVLPLPAAAAPTTTTYNNAPALHIEPAPVTAVVTPAGQPDGLHASQGQPNTNFTCSHEDRGEHVVGPEIDKQAQLDPHLHAVAVQQPACLDSSCNAGPDLDLKTAAPQLRHCDALTKVKAGAAVLNIGTWNTETLRLMPEGEANRQRGRQQRQKKRTALEQQAQDMQQRPEQLDKLRHIADGIVAQRMDVVALQEVTYSRQGEAALQELVVMLDAAEEASGTPGSKWSFIAHYDEGVKGNEFGGEMFAFLYKHVCGACGRTIASATTTCHVLGSHDRKQFVGESKLLQRTPAFARFYVSECTAPAAAPARGVGSFCQAPPIPDGAAAPAALHRDKQAPPDLELAALAGTRPTPRTYSVILMAVHAKAPTSAKQMGGTARDLQALGKLVKAIRLTNETSIQGSTPVVMLGDFNLDCANSTVFARILAKGWRPALAAGRTTNVKCERQFDNIWVQCGGAEDDGEARARAQDHGLIECEAAQVLPKPPEVPRTSYSDHCLVHCQLKLLKQLAPSQLPAQGVLPLPWPAESVSVVRDAAQSHFHAPDLALAYKGSLKALLSQVVVPSMGQRIRKVPRLGHSFGTLPCFGRRLYCCVCVEEEDMKEVVE